MHRNNNILYSNIDVMYNGNNLSDHNPVVIKTAHNILYAESNFYKYKILDWDKAKDEDIDRYKALLDFYLRQYFIPLHVTNCDNLFCDSHNDILIDKLDEFLEIMEYCAEFTIPTRTISNKSKGIPGWNDFVRPFKDKSILCNELWVSAGKPTSGTLFDERKFARTRYHWAIRYVKKNKESIILNKTAEQLSQKSFRNFWKFIK